MAKKQLDPQIATAVVNYCNKDLVPDADYDAEEQFESEWFESYFDFLGDENLKKHLGTAFYQARFMYKLMSALRLPKAKHQGIVKFQIIQYASIYEAILDYIIERDFKDEIMTKYADTVYSLVPALSKDTKVTYKGNTVYSCRKTTKKKSIKSLRIDWRTDFAVEKGIITEDIKNRICSLYDLRNNVHILKATKNNYFPQIKQSRDAFELMEEFVAQVKIYCERA